MASSYTEHNENMYFNCRKRAAKYNDKLNSREGASELLDISSSSLANYELGITKVVPVESILIMADVYNAPELKQWYCATQCPLGGNCKKPLNISSERAFIRAKNAVDDLDKVMEEIALVMDDGIITENEKEQVKKTKERLVDAKQRIEQLLNTIERAEKSQRF